MKLLSELIKDLEYQPEGGSTENPEISSVVYDSRKLQEGCLFVCLEGMNFDGHDFAGEAAEKGAAAIVIQHDVKLPEEAGTAVLRVEDTRRALALISAAWFDYPASRLTTIGLTGTKGKTTSTYLIREILTDAGIRTGLIGTIETIIADRHIPSRNTTPESYVLQQYLHEMAEEGMEAVVMEVSSQALMMHRTDGIFFDYGVFTNLSPDHVGPGEHKDFEDYLSAKRLLFSQCRVGIVNGDDSHTEEILRGNQCESVERYGLSEGNDLRASEICLAAEKERLGVDFKVGGLMELEVKFPMPGKFSVYNALCALAVCRHFEIGQEDIQRALQEVHVRGRIEPVHVSDEFTLLIDYAHNAMALESLLTSLREYKPGRLVAVFGCGGNRDRNRRFEMGEVSGRLADFTIITSDNPRFEEPEDIMEDIRTGIEKTKGEYIMIADRKEAIAYAISHGRKGDVIVLAGKGHEDYQEIKGEKHHMDERELIRDILGR